MYHNLRKPRPEEQSERERETAGALTTTTANEQHKPLPANLCDVGALVRNSQWSFIIEQLESEFEL